MRNGSKSPSKRNAKPEKPYKGFPLFAHASGQWAKKIRGKLVYFGVWATPDAALERFNREWPYLKDGRVPPPEGVSQDGCTVRELCNDFLESKDAKLQAGELSKLSFRDYLFTCEIMVEHFGPDRRVDDLAPHDFRSFRAKLAKRFGVYRLKNEINRTCIVLKYAHDNGLIEKPVKYGQEFERPASKRFEEHKNESAGKVFSADEIRRMLETADVHLRGMIYLGINCGFGNGDCGALPISAVDLETAWVQFPRPKTAIQRRIPLWPETVDSLRESLASRPDPASDEHAGNFFLTRYGVPWVRHAEGSGTYINSVGLQFRKLLKELGINGRKGLGFYSLRHSFETIGGESRDQVAVDSVMGHKTPGMGTNYRHSISDERLRAVVDVVHDWLFSGPEGRDSGRCLDSWRGA